VEAFNELFGALAVEEDETVAGDGGGAVAGALG
jgi:hypothetical protein